MNLPDFSDWPSFRGGGSVRSDGGGSDDDYDDNDSIEMSASIGSADRQGDEENWLDDDENNDENMHRQSHRRTSRRRRRRRHTSDQRRCCPTWRVSCSTCCSCSCTKTLLEPGSSPGAIANLCSATLGAGVLSLPYAICKCGIVPGLLLLLLAATSTTISIDMIIETCAALRLSSYEDITQKLLGHRALIVVESSIFVFCFGCAVAYVVAVGDILQQGIIGVFADQLPSFITREFAMILFWAVIMLPLSLLERIDSLRFASLFGIGSIAFLVLACVIHSVKDMMEIDCNGRDEAAEGHTDEFATSNADQDVRWLTPSSFWDVVLACPIIMFAFSCQVNVCAIYEELGGGNNVGGGNTIPQNGDAGADASPSASSSNDLTLTRRRGNVSGPSNDEQQHDGKADKMASVTRTAVAICVLFYSLIGTFAYLDFGERTYDNVLKNYNVQETHDIMMIAAFVCITIAVVNAFPLNVFPARATLEGVVWRLINRGDGNTGTAANDVVTDAGSAIDESNDALDQPLLGQEGGGGPLGPSLATSDINRTSLSSRASHVVLTLMISGGALLCALVVPDISVVFGIMGGTASSIICFIFPGLFVIKLNHAGDDGAPSYPLPTLWRKIQACSLILGGSLIGILSTAVTLYSMFT